MRPDQIVLRLLSWPSDRFLRPNTPSPLFGTSGGRRFGPRPCGQTTNNAANLNYFRMCLRIGESLQLADPSLHMNYHRIRSGIIAGVTKRTHPGGLSSGRFGSKDTARGLLGMLQVGNCKPPGLIHFRESWRRQKWFIRKIIKWLAVGVEEQTWTSFIINHVLIMRSWLKKRQKCYKLDGKTGTE